MDIKLYYNTSDNRCVQKVIQNELLLQGTLREDTSLIEPVITIHSNEIPRQNYAYIAQFSRYYFINNKESIRTGLWRLHLFVDPLMSFKADILALKVVVDKQSLEVNGDEYIDDGSLVTDNLMFKDIYNFSNGFNNTGEYILITAG